MALVVFRSLVGVADQAQFPVFVLAQAAAAQPENLCGAHAAEVADRHEAGGPKMPHKTPDFGQPDGLRSPRRPVQATGDGAEVGVRRHGHPVLGCHAGDRGGLPIDMDGGAAEQPRQVAAREFDVAVGGASARELPAGGAQLREEPLPWPRSPGSLRRSRGPGRGAPARHGAAGERSPSTRRTAHRHAPNRCARSPRPDDPACARSAPPPRNALVAVAALAAKTDGFTVGEFTAKVHAMTGQTEIDYTIRQAAYDVRKLRSKQLLAKPGHTRRYQVPSDAARTIVALLALRNQVIGPILAGVRSPRRGRKPAACTDIDRT